MESKTWKDADGYTVETTYYLGHPAMRVRALSGDPQFAYLHGSTVIAPVSSKIAAQMQRSGRSAEAYRQVGGVVIRASAAPMVQAAILELQAEEQSAAELLARNVPGLAELRAAYADAERYQDQFSSMMEDESNDGARPPARVKASPDALAQQYPAAAAYLKAEGWTEAHHDVKMSAGKKAVARIAAGEDYKTVLAGMEAEWSAHCTARVGD